MPTGTMPTEDEETAYLALGDSLAVGVGASDESELGYVGLIHAALTADDAEVTLRNLAVSGETSQSMIGGDQLTNAIEVIGVADPPVQLVTIDIGGNDLLALLGSDPCASEPDGDRCGESVATALAAYERNLRQILGELRAALDASAPDARLAIMTYFNPFSGTSAAYEAAGEKALLGSDLRIDCEAATTRLDAAGMNDMIACVGEETDAIVVDIQPAFAGAGLELTHIGEDDIHANDAGYELIAAAFLDALDVD